MESRAMTIGKFHILRVDPGEDVLGCVHEFLAGQKIRQAVLVGGYGTLVAHHLHWVKHGRIPPENAFGRGEGGIEILGMSGLVVDGEPHIHITLSTRDGAYGGHLEEGCRAYVVCELYFAELEGVALRRESVKVSVPEMGDGEVIRLRFGEG